MIFDNWELAMTYRSAKFRDTMEQAAKAMGLSVAEYLIRLHYHAYDAMRIEGMVK